MSTTKIFTLEEALALLPEVQAITAASVREAQALESKLESLAAGPARRELEERYDGVVRDWAGRIMELGVLVKGMWLVDFDSGDGIYYCWQHPEPTIEYFHDYGSGFAGRRPLGRLGIRS